MQYSPKRFTLLVQRPYIVMLHCNCNEKKNTAIMLILYPPPYNCQHATKFTNYYYYYYFIIIIIIMSAYILQFTRRQQTMETDNLIFIAL